MVTLPVPGRFVFAKQSIDDFCRQTWPSKNLVVVLNGGTEAARDALQTHVASLGRTDIHVLVQEELLNVGQLRNLSVAAASGDVVCQWDDDDRYHPLRLERQAALLIESDLDAVYLREVMQYFPHQGAMFWTNWLASPASAHPGTLMARRDAMPSYPTEGPLVRLGEDLVIARRLLERGRVGFLSEAAPLFVYVSHGANSWHAGHHRMLADTLGISRALLLRRKAEIVAGLEAYDFPTGRVSLHGSNGEAFVL